MSHRSRFLLAAGAWVAAVTGALVAVPLALRDRLPEPLASHWGPSGLPDDAMSFWPSLAVNLLVWALFAGFAVYVTLRRDAARYRARRRGVGAMLGGGAAFVLGLQWTTLAANLDRAGWQAAGELGGKVFIVLTGAVLAGLLGWLVASVGPGDPPVAEAMGGARLRLRPGQRAVWISSASNTWAAGLGVAGVAGALILAVWSLTVETGGIRGTAVSFAVVGVAGLAVSKVGVRVSDQGLVISFGPLRRPSRKIPLSRITSARAEDRRPIDVGGWGIRGLPGMSTIMVRGGECLVVRYPSGGELAVTVDDATRGAALLNALISEHHPTSP
ncbi:hypothetical protein [Sphaerisporangium perillae]|uniref:hypothetical protein n=1 Tax=Sphaerisporangium perillae TaxID=2935860 RepID=UPI00200D3442|nr:hypothetical protein [Sphaerisporangium perillae]